MNETSPNIRMVMWERKYPGSTKEIIEIFGEIPSVKKVAKWKSNWGTESKNHFCVQPMAATQFNRMNTDIKNITLKCGIHPYFWHFQMSTSYIDHQHNVIRVGLLDHNNEGFVQIWRRFPVISFYHGEHLVMFKLAWQT